MVNALNRSAAATDERYQRDRRDRSFGLVEKQEQAWNHDPTPTAMEDLLTARLTAFFESYRMALERGDARGMSVLYGYPCLVLTETYVGSQNSAEELRKILSRSHEFFRQFGMARATFKLIASELVTDRIIRARIRWNFFDRHREAICDTDYDYFLRQDEEGLRVYVVVSINEEQRIRELTEGKPGSSAGA